MEQREKLIKLLKKSIVNLSDFQAEIASNTLIANGVVVLPCNVGDTVYKVFDGKVWEMKAVAIPMLISGVGANLSVTCTNYRGAALTYELSDFGKTVFPTREEAEKALANEKKVTSDG